MAAQVSTPEVHPAVATEQAVEAKTADARAEAIKLIQAKAAEPEPAGDSVEATPPEPPASPAASDPEKPKEEDEKLSRRIALNKKTEQRNAKEREELRALKAQVEADKKAIEDMRREMEAKAERFKLLEQDPVKAFEELKLDPKAFLERLAAENDPNALVQREIAKEREARIALEKRLEEAQKASEKAREEQQRAAYEAHLRETQQSATQAFLGHLETNPEKYPHLTDEFTPDEIAEKAWRVALDHSESYKAQFGEYPDDSVIAEYLEAEAKKRAEARSAWRSRLKKTPEPGQGTASGTNPLKPRTLTNGNSSTKATAPKPWNEKDAREEALKIIAQMHASDSG